MTEDGYMESVKEMKETLDNGKVLVNEKGYKCYLSYKTRFGPYVLIDADDEVFSLGDWNNYDNYKVLKEHSYSNCGSIHVNQRYKHLKSNDIYVIKGAWSSKYPNKNKAFLMKENGKGHTYTGDVISVKTIWAITEEEFAKMCGDRPGWFTLIASEEVKESEQETDHNKLIGQVIDRFRAGERFLVGLNENLWYIPFSISYNSNPTNYKWTAVDEDWNPIGEPQKFTRRYKS